MTITLSAILTVLVVIAHPDDETLFGGFIYALTHQLNASVDLICVTNGEGGFTYAGLAESFYGNLKLSEEAIGRTHLPRIRQKELLGSGQILGIRKFFFYDQIDLKYSRDINIVLNEQWDNEWVIQQFQHTIKHGNGVNGYDLMVVILPSDDSHGHHTVSGLLALEAIDRLQQVKSADVIIPTVIGGSEFVLSQPPNYPGNRLAEVLTNITPIEFRFNLRWKIPNLPIADYQTILLWMAAEHKSQGSLVNGLSKEYNRDNEQYFYFVINERYGDNGRLSMIDAKDSPDWPKKGYVTRIKNEGQCGACWAFSATGALEGQHAKRHKKLVSLFEQNLVDCSQSFDNFGCNGGGWMTNAYQYVIDKGLDTEEIYPYTGVAGLCLFNPRTIDIKSLDASQNSFRFYSSGVYDESNCLSTQLDFAGLSVAMVLKEKMIIWCRYNVFISEYYLNTE